MQKISQCDISNLCSILEKAQKISIVTHTNPDGDALGSSLGLRNYLETNLGKDAFVMVGDPFPDSLSFMVSNEDRASFLVHKTDKEATERRLAQSDTIICLDFNSFQRASTLEPLLRESKAVKVLIDHHINPDRDSFNLVFSETEISSASELLYHILMEFPDIDHDSKRLPLHSAESLLTGMTTDTNNFGNSVYPTTLSMTSDLLEAGADRSRILSNLYNKYRENRIRLQGYLLSEKLKITDYGLAYMILDNQTIEMFDTKEGETEGFVNIPLSIDKVRMSILLKEDGPKMRVSIRSKEGTSANRCAKEFFNGGGHELAAGGRLYIPEDIPSADKAEEYVLKATEEFFKNN